MSKPHIGVIIASIRDERNGSAVKAWVQKRLQAQTALEYSIIDLKERNVPRFTSAHVPAQRLYIDDFSKRWSKEIEPLDGFLVVTPEYNRNMPGVLKDAFDHLFHEWCFKPIAFVGYSTGGAYRAVEHMQVTAIELNMVPIRRQLAIPIFESVENGKFTQAKRFNGELEVLLAQLEWWAKLLKEGRQAHPKVVL